MIPQIKEFDRLSTTVINSYVGPVFSSYLSHLGERFEAYPQLKDLLIMQSNGGVAPIYDSSRMAVRAICPVRREESAPPRTSGSYWRNPG